MVIESYLVPDVVLTWKCYIPNLGTKDFDEDNACNYSKKTPRVLARLP